MNNESRHGGKVVCAFRAILLKPIDLICPSGESIRIYRSRVNPPDQKYFASQFWKSEL